MKLRTLLFISFIAMVTTGCGMFGQQHRDHHPAADDAAPSTDVGMSMMQEGMQQHMQKMQDTMAKIHQSKSPKERQKLMAEHMTMMQDGMGMMRGDGEKKMCAGKKKDSMMSDGKMMCTDKMEEGKTKGDMCCGKCGMKMRMDMMEQMMGQMLEHQAATRKK